MKNSIVIKSIASLVSFLEDESVNILCLDVNGRGYKYKKYAKDSIRERSLATLTHMLDNDMIRVISHRGYIEAMAVAGNESALYEFHLADKVVHAEYGKGVIDELYNPSAIIHNVGVRFEGCSALVWFTKDGRYRTHMEVQLALDVPVNENKYALAE